MNVNGVNLTLLDSTGVYGYQWSEFGVMRGDDGYLYWGATSGCSCNSFADNLDEVTRAASWHDVANAAREFADGAYYLSEKQGTLDLVERLMRDQPAAFDASVVVVQS